MSGTTPNSAGSKSGAHSFPVRKSTIETSWKNSNAGMNSAAMIPTVVSDGDERAEAEEPLDHELAVASAAGAEAEGRRLCADGH